MRPRKGGSTNDPLEASDRLQSAPAWATDYCSQPSHRPRRLEVVTAMKIADLWPKRRSSALGLYKRGVPSLLTGPVSWAHPRSTAGAVLPLHTSSFRPAGDALRSRGAFYSRRGVVPQVLTHALPWAGGPQHRSSTKGGFCGTMTALRRFAPARA